MLANIPAVFLGEELVKAAGIGAWAQLPVHADELEFAFIEEPETVLHAHAHKCHLREATSGKADAIALHAERVVQHG